MKQNAHYIRWLEDIGNKKMIYGRGDSKILTRNVQVPDADQKRFCLSDDDILTLTGYAIAIEEHYSKKFGPAGK